jgi:hypothetical protein
LPLFSAMQRTEIDAVVDTVRTLCARSSRGLLASRSR